MKIRLLKDHTLGKQNDVIDVPIQKAAYLVRMKVAEEFTEEREPIIPLEKLEMYTISREKQEHEGLPTAKKRGRKPKQ